MNKQKDKIETVAIIGLGALGILFGNHLAKRMPRENLRIIADQERIKRYQREQIYCNGEACDFHYVTPEEMEEPADLILITVKYQGLEEAIKTIHNQVGEKTVILSALNGITSEEIIGKTYGRNKLLYSVAQGMDAVKEGNYLTYEHMGMLVFGNKSKEDEIKTAAVDEFFTQMELPHQVDPDMNRRMWGKFMLNVGVNQTAAVSDPGTYGTLQKAGKVRDRMIAAMREVITLSQYEKINLTEDDLNYWLMVLGTLHPEGKPSMRQDIEARRFSEVELFAGTVLELGRKYHVDTPINLELYRSIKQLESNYYASNKAE